MQLSPFGWGEFCGLDEYGDSVLEVVALLTLAACSRRNWRKS